MRGRKPPICRQGSSYIWWHSTPYAVTIPTFGSARHGSVAAIMRACPRGEHGVVCGWTAQDLDNTAQRTLLYRGGAGNLQLALSLSTSYLSLVHMVRPNLQRKPVLPACAHCSPWRNAFSRTAARKRRPPVNKVPPARSPLSAIHRRGCPLRAEPARFFAMRASLRRGAERGDLNLLLLGDAARIARRGGGKHKRWTGSGRF